MLNYRCFVASLVADTQSVLIFAFMGVSIQLIQQIDKYSFKVTVGLREERRFNPQTKDLQILFKKVIQWNVKFKTLKLHWTCLFVQIDEVQLLYCLCKSEGPYELTRQIKLNQQAIILKNMGLNIITENRLYMQRLFYYDIL